MYSYISPLVSRSFRSSLSISSTTRARVDGLGNKNIAPSICLRYVLPFFPPSALMKGNTSSRIIRSEEHTSELQSRGHLVCRLLLEKKKQHKQFVDHKSLHNY